MARKVSWVFDVVSPFAYLGLRQLQSLPDDVEVEFVPILFAGLLNHHGQLGNAEIPTKRRFTYRFALWRARKLGIPMRFPPAHPFNPLPALRLIVAAGSNREAVQKVFDSAFLHGHDLADQSVIAELAQQLQIGRPEVALSTPQVKQQLHANTSWAISRGVFGVPTLVVDDEIFWGHDAFEMALDFLQQPQTFQDEVMTAVDSLPVGAMRERK
ncbi:MAG: 2-hydroxychromene-2-carboxylate isomerase [Steroidobacter sp.]